MTSNHDLSNVSAVDLAGRIARGELTAAAAVEAYIARIEAVNPKINAVVVKRFDEARAEAKERDEQRAKGEPLGPLHGVPVTVKECLDVMGTPSTFGLPSRASHRPERDDEYVARWRRAGAVVLGKTNVSQCLMYVESDNPVYGRTNNPWDLERAPGGSSGGQGAIIAAGGPPLGLGTDIGGSVRVPAAFCGIASMKPTAGRLPDAGRLSAPFGQRAVLSQVGVLGRTVGDVALGLEVANGGRAPDVEPPMPLGDPASVAVGTLRVAFYTNDGVFTPCRAAERAVREAAAALKAAGASVTEWTPPDIAHAQRLYFGIMGADGCAGMSRTLGDNRRDRRIRMMELGVGRSRAGIKILRALLGASGRKFQASMLDTYGFGTADHYFQLVESQLDYNAGFASACDEASGGPFDVLLCPAFALPALRHGAAEHLILPGAYSSLFNVLGWPAGVVPFTRVRADEEQTERPGRDHAFRVAAATERGSAGLPIPVQVVARPFREHVALAVMQALENDTRARGDFPASAPL